MPFESSLPLIVANLALAAVALMAWLRSQSRSWLAIAFFTLSASLVAFTADRLVETDREQLPVLFPRLAAARVTMAKKAGHWLVRDAELEPVRPGR